MSCLEVLLAGPGFLLALGIVFYPVMRIAEKIDRPWAETAARYFVRDFADTFAESAASHLTTRC